MKELGQGNLLVGYKRKYEKAELFSKMPPMTQE
jgi:hypothetical protein